VWQLASAVRLRPIHPIELREDGSSCRYLESGQNNPRTYVLAKGRLIPNIRVCRRVKSTHPHLATESSKRILHSSVRD